MLYNTSNTQLHTYVCIYNLKQQHLGSYEIQQQQQQQQPYG